MARPSCPPNPTRRGTRARSRTAWPTSKATPSRAGSSQSGGAQPAPAGMGDDRWPTTPPRHHPPAGGQGLSGSGEAGVVAVAAGPLPLLPGRPACGPSGWACGGAQGVLLGAAGVPGTPGLGPLGQPDGAGPGWPHGTDRHPYPQGSRPVQYPGQPPPEPEDRRCGTRGRQVAGRGRALGPQARRWGAAMVQARGIAGVRVLQGLLSLAHRHEHAQIDRACGLALEHRAWRLPPSAAWCNATWIRPTGRRNFRAFWTNIQMSLIYLNDYALTLIQARFSIIK